MLARRQGARPNPSTWLFSRCRPGSTGSSALVNGGVGKSLYLIKDIELPEGGLAFLKVGDGKNIRSYTTCCGTLFNSAGGAVSAG